LFGAAGFEGVVLSVGGEILLARILAVTVFYGALWGVVVFAFGLREKLKTRLMLGIVFPYIVLIVSIFGLWYIFLAVRQFWIVIPAGVIAALAEERLYDLTCRRLKVP
jgi:hypothetical protein